MTAPKITLYSAFYGQPEPFNSNVFGRSLGSYRCIVFTDDQHLDVPDGVVKVVDPLRGLDPNRASRRCKLMPHRYLMETDWSIYIDNNAQIAVDPSHLIETLRDRPEFFFATRHPWRNCTYEEAVACIDAKKDSPEKIQYQMQHYCDLGFPKNQGLIHGGFLVRRHDHPNCAEFGDHWFEHILTYSRRDQLSAEFLAWCMGFEIGYIRETSEMKPLFDWPIFSGNVRRDDIAKRKKAKMFSIGKFFRKKAPSNNNVM